MFDKTQTYCFGRYLVDIPIGAVQKGQGNTYYATRINSGKGIPDFTTRVNAALTKRKNEPGKHGFKYVKSEFPEGGDKQIIVAKADLWGTSAYSLDAFVKIASQKVGSGHFYYLSGEGFSAKSLDSTIADYRDILATIRYRTPRGIPSEPGFCLENGFIANDGTHPQAEVASLAFRLTDNQDVRIRIESEVRFKPWPSLLTKQKQANLQGRFPGMIKTIKSGQLTVNGLVGEESLMSYPSDDKVGEAHNFTWETLGEEGRTLKPDILLEITSGEGIAGVTGQSSISTKQILALYEVIVKSIRLRPTGVNK